MDIENQMLFASRKDLIERAKKYEEADSEDDAVREMNDYEKNLMK